MRFPARQWACRRQMRLAVLQHPCSQAQCLLRRPHRLMRSPHRRLLYLWGMRRQFLCHLMSPSQMCRPHCRRRRRLGRCLYRQPPHHRLCPGRDTRLACLPRRHLWVVQALRATRRRPRCPRRLRATTRLHLCNVSLSRLMPAPRMPRLLCTTVELVIGCVRPCVSRLCQCRPSE